MWRIIEMRHCDLKVFPFPFYFITIPPAQPKVIILHLLLNTQKKQSWIYEAGTSKYLKFFHENDWNNKCISPDYQDYGP